MNKAASQGRGARHAPRLNVWRKTAYGVGQLAEGVVTVAFMVYVLFYYNQVLGLSGSAAGLALFIALLVDAVADPLMGVISDRTRSRLGRRHPYMYFAALPLPIVFFLLFAPPAGLGDLGLFFWLLAFSILTRLALTIFFVPHLAMGAELSGNYHERNQIVAYRQFFSMGGYLVALGLGFGVFFTPSATFPDGQLNPAAYAPFAASMCIFLIASMIASAAGTHAYIPYLTKPGASPEQSAAATLLGDLKSSMQDRSFRVLIFSLLVFYVAFGIRTSLSLHLYTHYWRLDAGDIELVTISGVLSLVIGVVIWALLGRVFEKRTGFIVGFIGWVGFTAWPVLQQIAGLYPPAGSDAYVTILVWSNVAASIMGAGTNIYAGSMIADCLDENELRTGKRQEGAFFGAFTLTAKATTGLGTWLSGVALDVIGFPANATPGSVPAAALNKLAILTGPLLIAGGVTALLVLVRYDLSRARHAQIQQALAQRRSASKS